MKEKTETKALMNPLITTVIVAIVVAGVSFFGGMKYQQSKAPAFSGGGRFGGQAGQNRGAAAGVPGGATGRAGFRPVAGQVISVDDKSMSVKLQDGSTKIVLLSDTTMYSKSNSGSKTDVTTGATVAVFGTENSDGSVTAQSIQLNPMQRGATGTPAASGQASPQPNY